MIKYNVTLRVERDIITDWIRWMKQEHIPDVMNTGIFTRHEFSEMIDPIDPSIDAVTFTVQYWCETLADLNRYFSEFAPTLRQKTGNKFGEKCLAFRSVMKEV